jgi:O-antigen ligase
VIAQVASAFCGIGILFLFILNKDKKASTSAALWIPVVWLTIGGSRNVSDWLQLSTASDYNSDYLEGSPVDRSLLTLLIMGAVVVLAGRRKRVVAVLRANAPVLVFFSYCALSVLWSDYPVVGFKRWIRGAGDVIMILVVLTETDTVEAIKRLYARVGFLFLPISVLFIRYFPDLGRAYGRDGSRYWTGVASGKNGLGMICLIFGIASVWRFIRAFGDRRYPRRGRELTVHAITMGLAVWLLWIADSKTSLASFVFASGLIAVTSVSTFARKRAMLHFMVATIISVSVSVLFLGIGSSALETMGRDPSLTGRMDVWKAVLVFAENSWIGAGYETFWLGQRLIEMSRFTGGINQAHNGYIEVYLNLGMIGVALLAVLIFKGYRNVLIVIRRTPDIGSLKVAYFVVAVVYNFTEGSFKMMSPVWITFLLMTMATPYLRTQTVPSVAPNSEGNAFQAGAPVTARLICVDVSQTK